MHRHHFIRGLALAALVGLAGTTASPTATAQAPTPAETRLAATIDGILADGRLAGAQAGVVVVDTSTGRVLYNRNGDRRLLPASNAKLLTSAAALEILGDDHRFTTEVRVNSPRRGKVLRGDLYLRGTGDPTMLAADYDRLAAQVSAAGIRTVMGNLVADDTWFDATRLGSDWAWDDETAYYAAQVSALTVAPDTDYDAGNVIVTATPGVTAGSPPTITMTPPNGYVKIENRASTVATGSDTISFERQHGTNTIVVTGQLAVDGSASSDWISVWEPTGLAADVFRRALTAHGVRVLGGTVPGRATPAGATPVATHRSMPLTDLMVPFLKLSNNGHAEVLTKSIGRRVADAGTWPAGLTGIRDYAASVGVDTATLRLADGSGLSRRSLVPPAEFTDLLVAARAEPWFQSWYAALPIAGNADRFVGGTLRNRMRGTPAADNVHAKTGSLTGVSSLSGYVTDADGHVLAFSILMNNYLASSVTGLQDSIAITLATYSASASGTTSLAPPAAPTAPAAPDGLECSWVKPISC
ncbi:D-alanyl-D-alanine carboxypeptidase/D-alanyl-D-alanine-endopeptidase [Plantactinospora sp. GCM10030261]|uniref:D-alanyl-D-alanine carboxypeptidase/D-alanyl-D-alanine endopeptidase n=1 Tax=Plantactinospora sp. GCM10030261 TaxID=3273420 RepID=UPI00360EB2C1